MSDLYKTTEIAWDVVVIGAGPAGSLAARQLALAGARVLLVDRAHLGRKKVCGCCLNDVALHTLQSVQLDQLIKQRNAVTLSSMQLATQGCTATIALPHGVSLSREAFDAALVQEAIASSATFLPETNASLGKCRNGFREVALLHLDKRMSVRAKVVLAADGLGCQLLGRSRQVSSEVDPRSRIGAGVTLSESPTWIACGTIYMACSRRGYLGLVVLEDGRLNVAAAFDRDAIREAGGPGPLAADIAREVSWRTISGLSEQLWKGTVALTRRAESLWDERVLVLGDAAGYVEPFTGEGMAWALASAVEITPWALKAIDCWSSAIGRGWHCAYQQVISRRQGTCRALARALRHPLLIRGAIRLLRHRPELAKPVVRRLNAY